MAVAALAANRKAERRVHVALAAVALAAITIGSTPLQLRAAQGQPPDPQLQQLQQPVISEPGIMSEDVLEQLKSAAIGLPLATLLGAALAFRPRRKGTPAWSGPVVQTQIILALIGTLVMLVVGSNLARAFGVVGAAGLIRYRAKIDDPKDAGVMLSTLAVGLASGVGLYVLAAFAAVFIMAVLWVLEWIEPDPYKRFELKVTSKQAVKLQPQLEQYLRRQHVEYELRTSSPEEICYDVHLPIKLRTGRISNGILGLTDATGASLEWDEKRKKEQT